MNAKIKNKKVFAWSLMILWMIIIFVMSSQTGDVSVNQSGLVIKFLVFIGIDVNSAFGDMAQFVIRKMAHFTEYFIFALLSYNLMRCYDMKKGKSRILMIIFAFLYAATDEFHQSFVPGRGPQFRDVLIDTCGAAAASLVLTVINYFKKNK